MIRAGSQIPSSPGGAIMLVLTRRVGEEIIVDGAITVTVLSVQGQKVRLGIIAPKSVRVDRSEISARRSATDDVPAEVEQGAY
jgi:carbon storage regulator